jgi:hypothetical protein
MTDYLNTYVSNRLPIMSNQDARLHRVMTGGLGFPLSRRWAVIQSRPNIIAAPTDRPRDTETGGEPGSAQPPDGPARELEVATGRGSPIGVAARLTP